MRGLRKVVRGNATHPGPPALAAVAVSEAPAEILLSRVAVSVVIPAFDAEATVGAALDSLAAQTFERWEAIVVDDGSSDGSADIARERASHDGIGAAREAFLLM